MDNELKKQILAIQKNELTEHLIYKRLAFSMENSGNKDVLNRIADDELRHYNFFKRYTERDIAASNFLRWEYFLISKILGLTFGIKLMEKGEKRAQAVYEKFIEVVPEAKEIIRDENEHETELLNLIDEEKLKYVGSMVLGLNDALVELTGALAGLTFALQNTRLVATAGLITGIAASLSMASSEYLSTKTEGDKNPVKASIYTGITYFLTVLFLIFPYLIFKNIYLCLTFTIFNAIMVILFFTFYTSVAKDMPFRKRFCEMAFISLGIAFLSFLIGLFVRMFLRIDA